MEKIIILIYIMCFFQLIIPAFSEYDFIYEPEEVINYINSEKKEKEDFLSIIDNILNTFSDAYAFYHISANPPQPQFDDNYYDKINILQNLEEMKCKITNEEITEVYDFYREITLIFSKLKDSHIIINWKPLHLQDFYIIAPFEFYLKKVGDEYKIFATCLPEDFTSDDVGDALDTCDNNDESPILTINGKDPLDFINNFGGTFLSTKNQHATFSFKLKNHNNIPLSDYPLSLEELNELKIKFESDNEIDIHYFIGSDEEINDNRRRNLKYKNDTKLNEENINKKRGKNQSKNRKRKLNNIDWNYETTGDDKDKFKCYEDNENEINIYYISSFIPEKKNNYIQIINYCYELFDKNTYPIVVINDLNEGGFISLSQLFLGILSPLISIDMYKGRIRLTNSFKETDEINFFVETNLTNTENCLQASYQDLINKKININYGNGIESTLSGLFFMNNKSLHNDIEIARTNMNNKRKPTEILVYTDGYTFSAASILMQYLQKSGGGIIAGYLGNPKYKDTKYFDISQSPSPIFNSNLLKIFSSDNYNNLLSLDDGNEWYIEMPGIQTFYDSKNQNIPLEYEVIQPDIHSNIYQNFDGESYTQFALKSKKIFEKYKTECNPNNKNLIKVSSDCDSQFPNKYTHGGYECNDQGKWSSNCVPSYCDPGYYFNKIEKKCVKDICSSIIITTIEDEENDTTKESIVEEEIKKGDEVKDKDTTKESIIKEETKSESQTKEDNTKKKKESSYAKKMAIKIFTICLILLYI